MAVRVSLLLILIAVPIALAAQGTSDANLSSMEMYGTIGPHKVGLNYTVRNDTKLVAAHYFYASNLTNIALAGSVKGETVEFKGEDGSVFHLHFVGNGSNGSRPLTFDNSIGLSGTWALGSRTLPVKLQDDHGTPNPGQPLYAQVTNHSDAKFEEMVRTVRKAILSDDAHLVAMYVSLPLRVNFEHHVLTIRSRAQFEADWSLIFSPAMVARIRADIPHEMFVHEGEAMLGSGDLWFDQRGVAAINASNAE